MSGNFSMRDRITWEVKTRIPWKLRGPLGYALVKAGQFIADGSVVNRVMYERCDEGEYIVFVDPSDNSTMSLVNPAQMRGA